MPFLPKKIYSWNTNAGTWSTTTNWDSNSFVPNKYNAKVTINPSVSGSVIQVTTMGIINRSDK